MPSEVLMLNGKKSYITTCKDGSIVWEVNVDACIDMDRAEKIFGEDIMYIYSETKRDILEPDIAGKYYQIGSGEYYIVSDDCIHHYECNYDNSTLTKLKPNAVIQILCLQQDEYYCYKMLKIIAK